MSQITATDLTREDLTMFSCVSFLKKTLSGIGEHSQRKSSIIPTSKFGPTPDFESPPIIY